MNRIGLKIAAFGFLLLGVIACEVYLQLRPLPDPNAAPDSEPSSPLPPSSTPPADAAASGVSPPVITAPALALASPGTTGPGELPKQLREKGVVEFSVVHGLAIAYGDVLLGKVTDGFAQKAGYFEVPPVQLWDRPVIPYSISPSLPHPERVKAAVDYFNKNTPVQFVPYQGEKDAIVFQPGEPPCHSLLGRQGGLQPINISDSCDTRAVMHEMMHALGFIHEQSRPDRDRYVSIDWTAMDAKYWPQYAQVPDALVARPLENTPFDYQSLMLYPSNADALDPQKPTMVSKTSTPIAPSTSGLSPQDIQKLLKIYQPEDVPHL